MTLSRRSGTALFRLACQNRKVRFCSFNFGLRAVEFLCSLGLVCASCSSGPSAAQRQIEALAQVQKVVHDANAVSQLQGFVAQDVAPPCPADITPENLPKNDCSDNPPTPTSELKQAKAAVASAKKKLTRDEQGCVSLLSAIPGGKADGVTIRKSNCYVNPPPPPMAYLVGGAASGAQRVIAAPD